MEYENGKEIIRLRALGYGYKRIAAELNIPLGTVKTFCRRQADIISSLNQTCKECGRKLEFDIHRREKKFCSNSCRMKWWRNQKKHIGSTDFVCGSCGEHFIGYKSQNRKFCSRNCYYESLKKGA